MIKVEYLLIVDQYNCSDKKSLMNLLRSNSDIEVTKEYVIVSKFPISYEITERVTQTSDEKVYFNCSFWIDDESKVELFSSGLKTIRRVLSIVNRFQYIMWDGLSLHYSKKAYERVYYIENMMRKLLSKCMLVNLGMEWDSSRIPTDVINTINKKNTDVNVLSNIDFIQLKNVLFSTNYPDSQSRLLDVMTKTKSKDELDWEELKTLLPTSNWNKYFKDIIDCDAQYLEKRWQKLYDLRNKIAHNKQFTGADFEEVENLVNEIGPIIEQGIINIEKTNASEETVGSIIESILESNDENASKFLDWYYALETDLKNIYRQHHPGKVENEYLDINEVVSTIPLLTNFPDDIINRINEIVSYRNKMTHSVGLKLSESKVEYLVTNIEDLVNSLRDKLEYDENDHLEPIKSGEIIDLYLLIRDEILKWNQVELKVNKHYISFIHNGIFADLKPMQKSLKIWLNMKFEQLNDKEKIARDVSTIGHLGSGSVEINASNKGEINYVLSLIKQSYLLSKK